MKIVDKVKSNQKLMRFIETTQNRITDSEMGTTSVVVAYYLLLSLFPLMIALGNLLPYLSIDPNTVLSYVQELIPSQIYDFIGPAIENLLTTSSGGLLSISALAALWSASQSINALQIAMNKAFGVDQRSNFIVVRAVSFVIILLFMIAIVGVTMVFGLGKIILDFLQPIFKFQDNLIDTFQTVKWPVTIVALLFIMMLIYWLVPNAKVKLRSTLLIRPLLCCENHWLSNYWKFYCFNDLVESCCDDYYLGWNHQRSGRRVCVGTRDQRTNRSCSADFFENRRYIYQ